MTTPAELNISSPSEEKEKRALNKRLESAAWGLFLVMLGLLRLVSEEKVPQDAWLLGAGMILLALNAVRYFLGIRPSGFTVFLGVIGVLLGIGGLFAVDIPVFPILIILIGLSMVWGTIFRVKIT